MRRTFHVPSRFNPAYSLLGRWMQRMLGDVRRAEGLFYVVLFMIALALILAQYFAWILLQPTIVAEPAGTVAMTFWLSQIGGVVLYGFTCVIGFRPALWVTVSPSDLHLQQGSHALTLFYDAITSVETITALRFHQHYGRYAATQVFITRMPTDLLLLHTIHGPVVVGLLPGDHDILRHHLEHQHAAPFDLSIAGVA